MMGRSEENMETADGEVNDGDGVKTIKKVRLSLFTADADDGEGA